MNDEDAKSVGFRSTEEHQLWLARQNPVLTPLAEQAIKASQELTDLFDDVIVKIKFEPLSRKEQYEQLFRVYNQAKSLD